MDSVKKSYWQKLNDKIKKLNMWDIGGLKLAWLGMGAIIGAYFPETIMSIITVLIVVIAVLAIWFMYKFYIKN